MLLILGILDYVTSQKHNTSIW